MLQQNYKLSLDNYGFLEVDFIQSVHNEGQRNVHIHLVTRGYNHAENTGNIKNSEKIYPVKQDVSMAIPETALPTLITILQKIKF